MRESVLPILLASDHVFADKAVKDHPYGDSGVLGKPEKL